jgi:hypothetical protein
MACAASSPGFQRLCIGLGGPAANPKSSFRVLPCMNATLTVCNRSTGVHKSACEPTPDGCLPPWLRLERKLFHTLVEQLKSRRHQQGMASASDAPAWLLLMGDSDTRGMTFALLQMLSEMLHGRARTSADHTLWLGTNATPASATPRAPAPAPALSRSRPVRASPSGILRNLTSAPQANMGSRICHMCERRRDGQTQVEPFHTIASSHDASRTCVRVCVRMLAQRLAV